MTVHADDLVNPSTSQHPSIPLQMRDIKAQPALKPYKWIPLVHVVIDFHIGRHYKSEHLCVRHSRQRDRQFKNERILEIIPVLFLLALQVDGHP